MSSSGHSLLQVHGRVTRGACRWPILLLLISRFLLRSNFSPELLILLNLYFFKLLVPHIDRCAGPQA